MRDIPDELLHRPFTRAEALALSVTPRMLRGLRFLRLHHAVYCVRGLVLTQALSIDAARLALPPSARLTGITAIQRLGLDFGPMLPLHFVVQGDHHLDLAGVFLHRTVQLAPSVDDESVTAEAAFIAFCSSARGIDAIKVGDWLLHEKHMDLDVLVELANRDPWRDGAQESLWVANHLDGRSASLPESEVRSVLRFAGLPTPESNRELDLGGDRAAYGDLVYLAPLLLLEYEGLHHQEQRGQYTADIGRYEVIRRHDLPYLQITKERLARPKRLARDVHAELVRLGYDGPAPVFGEQWKTLFARVTQVVGPKEIRGRAA